MALNVTQGGETVPLSVLSQRSGVSIATINAWNRLGAAFRFAPPIQKRSAAA